LTDDSLQSADKDQQERLTVAEKLHDAVVKFDTYQNLQWHRTVFPAIALLSCSSSFVVVFCLSFYCFYFLFLVCFQLTPQTVQTWNICCCVNCLTDCPVT